MIMTPQEHEKLQEFLTQLKQAQGVQRDPEADALISAAVARQPDAAYLLVQRTLLQDQALEAAKARIADLERQLQSARPASGTSFLGGGDAWGNSARSAPLPPPAPSASYPAAAPAYPQEPAYQANNPAAYPGQRQGGWSRFGGGMGSGMGGGGGSFLGTMAATAAGVAGGAFLFQGIGNMLGQHGNDAGQHGLASSLGGDHGTASDSSLARDAGVDNVSAAPAQEYSAMDDSAASDDFGVDDFSDSGDDTVI
jgi:hypothetical protein